MKFFPPDSVLDPNFAKDRQKKDNHNMSEYFFYLFCYLQDSHLNFHCDVLSILNIIILLVIYLDITSTIFILLKSRSVSNNVITLCVFYSWKKKKIQYQWQNKRTGNSSSKARFVSRVQSLDSLCSYCRPLRAVQNWFRSCSHSDRWFQVCFCLVFIDTLAG